MKLKLILVFVAALVLWKVDATSSPVEDVLLDFLDILPTFLDWAVAEIPQRERANAVANMIENLDKNRKHFAPLHEVSGQREDLADRYGTILSKLLEIQIEQAEAMASEKVYSVDRSMQ